MYSKLKNLTTFVGVGILVFYYSEQSIFSVNLPIFLIGVLFFLWYVIEEVFSFRSNKKKNSVQAYADIVLGAFASFYIIRFLVAHQLGLAIVLLSLLTLLLIAILILLGFIQIFKRT
jgi:hypothetical protein